MATSSRRLDPAPVAEPRNRGDRQWAGSVTPYGDDAATINMFIVDASMRGRGLGRQLMQEALAKAGERTCYLVATNDGLSLYQKLGFVATGGIVQHQGQALPADTPAHVSWSKKGDYACFVA